MKLNKSKNVNKCSKPRFPSEIYGMFGLNLLCNHLINREYSKHIYAIKQNTSYPQKFYPCMHIPQWTLVRLLAFNLVGYGLNLNIQFLMDLIFSTQKLDVYYIIQKNQTKRPNRTNILHNDPSLPQLALKWKLN